MKKLITIFFATLLFCSAFAEDFNLFPWFSTKKDIYSYCISKGWKYEEEKDINAFQFTPSNDVMYRNNKISYLYFIFDNKDNVINQSVTFDNMYDNLSVHVKVLNFAVQDKARLFESGMTKDDLIMIKYFGTLENNVNVDYIIYGHADSFMLSLVYHTY